MKGVLEFKLPEESEEFALAQEAIHWKAVVSDLLEFVRNETKHKDHTAEEYAVFDLIRDHVAEDLKDRGLSVW